MAKGFEVIVGTVAPGGRGPMRLKSPGEKPTPKFGGESTVEEVEETPEVEATETEEHEEMEGGVKLPHYLTPEAIGYVPAENRCKNCEYMAKAGTCLWTEQPVDPEDGCVHGFEMRTGEDETHGPVEDLIA